MRAKKTNKNLSPGRIAHNKFLTKLGVSPQQIKARKKAERLAKSGIISKLVIDTISSVRNAYDD